VFADRRKTGRLDLEAVEMAVRSALHQAGAALLSQLLRFEEPAAEQRRLACPCGQQTHYHQLRTKPVLTALGWSEVTRPYYRCPHCHAVRFPADAELDIENTAFSPGVRRMQALVGQAAPFDQGRQQLRLLAALEVTAKAVERQAEAIGEDLQAREQVEIQRAMRLDLPAAEGEPVPILYLQIDGTGIPVVNKETAGRKGKIDGQPAHTREAKLGCVFTQSGWDEQGYALRDPASTTYTGAIETADEFGQRLYLEAWNRGWGRAPKKVIVGDGAAWIWNLAQQYFPGAIEIVDLFHARQHLWELARQLHPHDPRAQQRWIAVHQKGWLDQGKIEKLVASLRAIVSPHAEVLEKLRTEADYFETHAARMRYPQFRKQHLFVGSGVIEAGCKSVIGSRLKQSGMFWTLRGANSILALRCAHLNGRFEDYWANRSAA
jgi:hypothetical protein